MSMEIITSDTGGGIPPYPYRKVVIVADRAEVAALPCDGAESENIIYHADLLDLLRSRTPELDGEPAFTAGWLTQAADEAVLHLALASEPTSAEDAERIGRAMSEWCSANGISRLTITDSSRSSGTEAVSEGSWDIDDWNPSS